MVNEAALLAAKQMKALKAAVGSECTHVSAICSA